MSWLRRVLLSSAESRLCAAKPDLHRVPDLPRLHLTVSIQLIELGPRAPLRQTFRLWWCAFCIERCSRHALRAEGCQR